jgi:hypothetical protein
MEHTNKILKEILREEYGDYDENHWNYDTEYRMLEKAYKAGKYFRSTTISGVFGIAVIDDAVGDDTLVILEVLKKQQEELVRTPMLQEELVRTPMLPPELMSPPIPDTPKTIELRQCIVEEYFKPVEKKSKKERRGNSWGRKPSRY